MCLTLTETCLSRGKIKESEYGEAEHNGKKSIILVLLLNMSNFVLTQVYCHEGTEPSLCPSFAEASFKVQEEARCNGSCL